jgi:hypothetical protein
MPQTMMCQLIPWVIGLTELLLSTMCFNQHRHLIHQHQHNNEHRIPTGLSTLVIQLTPVMLLSSSG